MFCNKCGKEISEGTKFCPYCGEAQLASQTQTVNTATNNAVNTGTAYTQPVNEAPQVDPVQNQMYFNSVPTPEPIKKKKKGLKIFLAIAIPVLILGVAAILYFTVFKDMFISEKQEFKNAEKESGIIANAEVINEINPKKLIEGEYSVKLDIAEQGKALLSQFGFGSEEDIDWLDDIEFKLGLDIDDDEEGVVKLAGTLVLNSTDIVSVAIAYNQNDNAIIMDVPEILDRPIYMDLSSVMDRYSGDLSYQDALENLSMLQEALPEDIDIEKIIERYVDIILDSFEPVSQDISLNVNGVEQKLTEMAVKLDSKQSAEILLKILETVKNDKDIKNIVEPLLMCFGGIEYSELIQEIDSAIDELKNEEVISSIPEIEYSSYLDDDDIVGERIVVGGEEIFSYAVTEDDGKFGFEAYIGDNTVSVIGTGTCKKDKYTGDFELQSYGESVFSFETEDFGFEDGAPRGTVKLSADSLGGEVPQMLGQLDIAVIFTDGAIKLDFSVSGMSFIAVSFEKTGDEANIKMPNSSNVYRIEDEDDLDGIQNIIDVEALIEAFEDAGVPVEDLIGSQSSGLAAVESSEQAFNF